MPWLIKKAEKAVGGVNGCMPWGQEKEGKEAHRDCL